MEEVAAKMTNRYEDFRMKKFGLKILSLLMALMLWFYVINQGGAATSQDYQQTKLNYFNVPTGLMVNGPDTVSVRIWGSTKTSGNVEAYVDLSGLQQGSYKLPVKVKPLQGVLFATVQPDKVDVELKSPADRSLAIKYELPQNLPTGVELRDVSISPEKCIVRGEQEAVSKVASVYVPINVGGEMGILSQQVSLVARDAKGNKIASGIQLIPSAVNVYAVAENKKTTKDLAVKLKFKGKVADGYELGTTSIDPATVSALGDESSLKDVEEITSLEIDLTDRKEAFTEVVALQVPDGIIISPGQVTVVVNIQHVDNEAEQ
jgi:YbbR domain-containing protein